MSTKKQIALIGGGPAVLLCASFLDESKYDISIYEQNNAVGRKFLVAGKGGFNLTHSEKIEGFLSRYLPLGFMDAALKQFDNLALRKWLLEVGIETFVGSSKRVYPIESIKPIEVLNVILKVLEQKNVNIITNAHWRSMNGEVLSFDDEMAVKADKVIFGLGGNSWKVTGSDGKWISEFQRIGILINPFKPANCRCLIDWKSDFINIWEGMPIKNIDIYTHKRKNSSKGEAVFTKEGIEGGAIYALSPQIQEQLEVDDKAIIYIDLKPMKSGEEILSLLQVSTLSISDTLRKRVKLEKVKLAMLKTFTTKEEYNDPVQLMQFIKRFPLTITGIAPIDEAISTTGGVSVDALHSDFSLKNNPNIYCIGEMVDWYAPTGGYLLQGCFSMGVMVAKKLNRQ